MVDVIASGGAADIKMERKTHAKIKNDLLQSKAKLVAIKAAHRDELKTYTAKVKELLLCLCNLPYHSI